MRGAALILAAIAASFVLSGCVFVTGSSLTQQGVFGPLVYELNLCASQTGSPVCPNRGDSDLQSTTDVGQMLVAVLIPTEFTAPASFTTVAAGGPVFAPSPTYTAELQTLTPAAVGTKWAGYISDARSFAPGSTGVLRFTFERSRPAEGPLLPTSQSVGVRVGSRVVSATSGPGTRPVECGPTANDLNGLADDTVCVDSSATATNVNLRDAIFSAGAPVTTTPGQTGLIPVTVRFAGPASVAATFSLAGSTNLSGATAVPNAITFAPPANSTNTVSVSVAVPATAAPGTYTVTLTGTLGSGESRAATGTLIVAAPATTPGGGAPTAPGPGWGYDRRCAVRWRAGHRGRIRRPGCSTRHHRPGCHCRLGRRRPNRISRR